MTRPVTQPGRLAAHRQVTLTHDAVKPKVLSCDGGTNHRQGKGVPCFGTV